jgi:hypothetical protein
MVGKIKAQTLVERRMKASSPTARSGIALSIATLIAILATLTVNILSNIFPPEGLNIGEISNTLLRGVLITPANYAFSIWGIIYIGLIAYGIYQLRAEQRGDPTIQQTNVLLIIACLAQIAWVYLFTHQQFGLSIVAIVVILLSLIAAYLKLKVGQIPVTRDRQWMAHIPFSIYLGWISVATIVNVASALYIANWDGWGLSGTVWTLLMLVVGAGIGAVIALQRADLALVGVLVWAYLAIAVRLLQLSNLALAAGLLALGLVIAGAVGIRRRRDLRLESY